jgi:hypothetical protein
MKENVISFPHVLGIKLAFIIARDQMSLIPSITFSQVRQTGGREIGGVPAASLGARPGQILWLLGLTRLQTQVPTCPFLSFFPYIL